MKPLYRMILVGVFFSLLASLNGCDNGSLNEPVLKEITLKKGDTLTVNSGDKLVPLSDHTQISVTHVLEDGTKTLTITAGKATLIRSDNLVAN